MRTRKSTGNIRRMRMNVYFFLRSARLNRSSQLGPQNSFSYEIGVAQITQCLCLGITALASGFKYFDIILTPSLIASLLNSLDTAHLLRFRRLGNVRKCATSSSYLTNATPCFSRMRVTRLSSMAIREARPIHSGCIVNMK